MGGVISTTGIVVAVLIVVGFCCSYGTRLYREEVADAEYLEAEGPGRGAIEVNTGRIETGEIEAPGWNTQLRQPRQNEFLPEATVISAETPRNVVVDDAEVVGEGGL